MKIIIFCGGYGTRMWPASRKSFPKQFFPVVGGRSFFELTWARFRKIFKPEDIFLSTEEKYVSIVKKQAPGIPARNIIAEPERRDNLGAFGLACAIIDKYYLNETVMASWSDQLITNETAFLKAVKVALEYAKETGFIVSLDEKPKYPSVHNGWVKKGIAIDEYKGFQIIKVTKHVEKPEIDEARKMFISGNYLLNTGYRAFKVRTMLSFYEKYALEVYKGLGKIIESLGSKFEKTIVFREYHKFPKDSVEKAIFEKMPEDGRIVMPIDVGWKDAGTWELFYKALKGKEGENVVETQGEFISIESSENLVIGHKGKLISLIGVSGLGVVDTPDALCVFKLEDSAKVKELFGLLEERFPEFVA